MTHDEIVEIARKWLARAYRPASGLEGGHGACNVVAAELVTSCWETPDAIGWHSGFTTLVECKVSRSDFLADRKKYFRQNPEVGLGYYRYFMAPKGLLKPDEMPAGWGLIEVDEKGKTRVVHRPAPFYKSNKQGEVDLLLSILCRLRVEPGRHVKIRSYNIDDGKEPRASVTFNIPPPEQEADDE
jgi:hypothetical protein